MVAAWLALLLGQAAVLPPMEQRSADCTRPVYASDHLLCGDAGLRQLDAEMAMLLAAGPEPAGRWIEPQAAWFRRSRICAFQAGHHLCLAAAYHERIALLRAWRMPPSVPGRPCRPTGLRATRTADILVVSTANGRIAGVAAVAVAGWKPFLAWRAGPRDEQLYDRAGLRLVRCRRAD